MQSPQFVCGKHIVSSCLLLNCNMDAIFELCSALRNYFLLARDVVNTSFKWIKLNVDRCNIIYPPKRRIPMCIFTRSGTRTVLAFLYVTQVYASTLFSILHMIFCTFCLMYYVEVISSSFVKIRWLLELYLQIAFSCLFLFPYIINFKQLIYLE